MRYFFSLLLTLVCMFFYSQKQMTTKEIDSINLSVKKISFDNEGKNYTALCTEVYYQSRNIDYKKGQIEALLKLDVFRINARKDYDKVITASQEVEKLATENDDPYSLCIARTNRAYAYLYLGLFEESEKTILDTFKYVDLLRKKSQKHSIKVNSYFILGSIYDEFEDMKNCIYYNKKMYAEAMQMEENDPNKENWMRNASGHLSRAYTINGQLKEAGYYLKIQEKYITKNTNKHYLATYHNTKAQFEAKNKANNKYYLDSAITHFKKAEIYAKESDNKLLLKFIYNDLADVYAEKKDSDNQINSLEKANKLKDSLDIVRKLNLQKVNLEVNEKVTPQEIPKNSNIFPILIFGAIAASLSAGLVWKYKFSAKKSKFVAKTETSIHSPDTADSSNLSANELYNLALKNDHSFYYQFQNSFLDFDKKLLAINSTIKVSDIEFCAFIKLNLDTKQIAKIKKMTIGAVEAKKYRIRKKLNISSEESMGIWISRL